MLRKGEDKMSRAALVVMAAGGVDLEEESNN